MGHSISSFTRTRARFLLTIIAVTIASAYLAFASAAAGPDLNANHRADPVQFRAGELNQEAVKKAETFSDFPLVWLGEEFNGFYLTEFLRFAGGDYDVVYLIYGTCEQKPSSEPSCVPPLSIVVSAPGSVPPPSAVAGEVAGPVGTSRGVTSRTLSGSPFLWTGGVVITVDANSEHQATAVAELRSANHAAMGFREVAPGDSLASLAGR